MLDTEKMLEYTDPIKDDLASFNQKLSDYLRGDSPLISSIARHLLKSRGKRIRPVFLFLTSRAGDNFTEFSVEASLAIELIHTATLLHDDVVDESDMRRGQETVNSQWTNLISVLMGDYLFAKAFRTMVEAESIELMRSISRATERVAVGELRQIEETGNYDLTEEAYLNIIADKTASLFSVACEAGPILTKRDQSERDKYAGFGEKVGIAFQIADDLLDFEGDPKVTGKQPGIDVMTGQMTLPLIYALQKANEKSRNEIISMLKESKEDSFDKVHAFIRETGGIDYAYQRANQLCQEGLEQIASVKESVYYNCLKEMVIFTTSRKS